MKTLNKIFLSLGIAGAAFGMTSCVDDLDQTPTNPSQIGNVSDKMDAVFADIFMNFSTYGANGNSPVHDFDGGMASFQRALFIAEEMPTDEACWLWDPGDYGNLNYGLVSADLNCLFGFYSRLTVNISVCNDFIQQVERGAFNDSDSEKAQDYVRQARIMRALCYFYMCSFYPNVPYADESMTIGDMPIQLPRSEVYKLVTDDLETVVAAYEPNQKPYYGYVGLDAAEAILVKFYLNAEAFGASPAWDKCLQHANNIISRLGVGGHYNNGLAQSYKTLFGYNNDQYVLGNNANEVNEIILSLIQDRVHLTSYSGATFLICAWIGTNAVQVTLEEPKRADFDSDEAYQEAYKAFSDPKNENHWKYVASYEINGVKWSGDPEIVGHVAQNWYNAGDGWKCMVARKSFVKKFDWDDSTMASSADTRTELWCTSAQNFTADNPSLVGDDWGNNGYLAVKFSNWAYNEDGSIDNANTPPATAMVGGDYPVIRLAEIYLSAAEAIMNGGGGSQADALKYVNYIRVRAGLEPWTAMTMQQLRDERCRELYQENTRRTDLIRYGQWCAGYNWEWKGGSATGANLPDYARNYPLPSRVMGSGFVQTPNY